MKKRTLLALLLCLAFLLGACGGGTDTSGSPAPDSAAPPAESKQPDAPPPADKSEAPAASGNVTPKGQYPVVTEPTTIKLAVAQNTGVEDYKNNQYCKWLEEKTGITLEFDMLPAKDAYQKVQLTLASNSDMPDGYMRFAMTGYNPFSVVNAQQYASEGKILALNSLIDEYGDYLLGVFEEQPELRPLMTSADGNIYFVPGYSPSLINKSPQKIWINQGWLQKLQLEEPKTIDDFYKMLVAFRDNDPNGNKKKDEIPFAGSTTYMANGYDAIINAFIYNDPLNMRLIVQDGKVDFAANKQEWRDALIFLNKLHDEKLFSGLTFTQDDQQLKQMGNDEADILGCFTSLGIQLIASAAEPEKLARYTSIPPLTGPKGVQYYMIGTPLPLSNGVITTACKNPAALFRLFDLMMSEEACLMGRYGEKGVDWDVPAEGDKSIFGGQATVKIINQIWSTLQNKHWSQTGPYISRPKYSNGQGWNGNPLDPEYLNATAAMKYEGKEPPEYIKTLIMSQEEVEKTQTIRTDIETYVATNIAQFITGEKKINDDAAWEAYVAEFDKLKLPTMLEVANTVYTRMNSK